MAVSGSWAKSDFKPGWSPLSASVSRSGSEFTYAWHFCADATNSTDKPKKYHTGRDIKLVLKHVVSGTTETDRSVEKNLDASAESHTVHNYSEWKDGNLAFDREKFHPVVKGRYVKKVTAYVRGKHRISTSTGVKEKKDKDGKHEYYYVGSKKVPSSLMGKTAVGDWSTAAEFEFAKPEGPTLDVSASGGTVSASVSTPMDSSSAKECYRTRIVVKTQTPGQTAWTTRSDVYDRTGSYTVPSFGIADVYPSVSSLTAGGAVKVRVEATAQGIRGDSDTNWRELEWAKPQAPSVTGCTVTPAGTGNRQIAVRFKTGTYTDTVQLQRCVCDDSEGYASWTAVGDAVPSGSSTTSTLYDYTLDFELSEGQYVFYRVVAANATSGLSTPSAAWNAMALHVEKVDPAVLYTPKVSGASIDVRSYPTATSATVRMLFSWTASSAFTGYHFSIATSSNAWYDSSATVTTSEVTSPNTYGGRVVVGGVGKLWSDYTFTGLSQGQVYYVRARIFRTVTVDGTEKTYTTPWTPTVRLTTPSAEDDNCWINSITPNTAGTGATVNFGFSENNLNTGTEIGWATDTAAWSNSGITLNTATVTGSSSPGIATIATGISEGATYFVRARRYLEAGGTTTYSPWSNFYRFTARSIANTRCAVAKSTASADGRSVTLRVYIDNGGYSGSTATRVQWSDSDKAWTSNVEAESFDAKWAPTAMTATGGFTYYQDVVLRDLKPNTSYWCKVARVNSAGTEGTWSALFSFRTATVTAADDVCDIVAVEHEEAGSGYVVRVGWNEDTGNTGTELAWSTEVDAWTSNEQPDSLTFDWADSTSASAAHGMTATVNLHGLDSGSTYYLRARRYLDLDGETSYSAWSSRWALSIPAGAGALGREPSLLCRIADAEAQDDGRSILVAVEWEGDRTGCELSWSPDARAWESNDQPDTMEFDWCDDGQTSARAYITGLDEGTAYYVRARTYWEGDDERCWSEYAAAPTPITPYSRPSSVVLTAPSYVVSGDPIELWWTVGSEQPQTEWHVHEVGVPWAALASSALEEARSEAGSAGAASLAHASISPDVYGDAESLSLYVSAACGGGLTDSDARTIDIVTEPAAACSCDAVLTAQPAAFDVCCDVGGCSLLATLRADGVSAALPDGDRTQVAGDSVWTGALDPDWAETTWGATALYGRLSDAADDAADAYADAYADMGWTLSGDASAEAGSVYWELSGGAYSPVTASGGEDPSALGWYEADDADDEEACLAALAAMNEADAALAGIDAAGDVFEAHVELPEGLELVEGAGYTLTAACAEPVAGVKGPEAACGFTVEWAHRAPAPSDLIEIAADEDDRSVDISLAAPEGAGEGDVYDVYRRNVAGYDLIASSVALDATVHDAYAPFSKEAELDYAVALRTPDGDVEWAMVPYELGVSVLRFDWDGNSVELPYNLELSESWAKGYESREHLDGSVNGYYGAAAFLTGSYSVQVPPSTKPEQARVLHVLGAYPGPAFCRSATGEAFECNVEPSIDVTSMRAPLDASFSVTRHDTGAAYATATVTEE